MCDKDGLVIIPTPDGPDKVACTGCPRCREQIHRQDARDLL